MSCKSSKKHKLAEDIKPDAPTVCVHVGTIFLKQVFCLPVALLKKSSPYWANNETFESEDGQIEKAPTSISVKRMPGEAEIRRLENDLRLRFDSHMNKLVCLYALGEKYGIETLMNSAIDIIQEGFFKYGAVFGPGLNMLIFKVTKPGSQLRNLCVGANVMHLDRGCTQLRQEMMKASVLNPAYFSCMMKWIARNFVMFAKREQQGYDNRHSKEGFSMFNRTKLCECHFHTHKDHNDAHKGHELVCKIQFLDCSHGEESEDDKEEENESAGQPFDIGLLIAMLSQE